MMPELGKYAGAVIGSYAASILILLALVVWSMWRGAAVKRALREAEARQGKNHG